jgi:hypothetical protein
MIFVAIVFGSKIRGQGKKPILGGFFLAFGAFNLTVSFTGERKEKP